ncbi:M16 family metallopeptidase [Deinococcus multiflagellatus]|uniref:M16 family metallopeptidase n=1 Tax=Deinococcus multiflagellatus TaxID=1656887 RepID=UPI001CC9E243|nr:pitrilysin family protein [Deinococcus multiflagellatus]MBZ9715004.1 insulinase family protein [Deinococcus multiflagellatus]
MELYTTGYLDNGLGFLIAPRPGAHLIHLAAYLDHGVKDEDEAENGISHLLEHLLFNPNNLTGTQGKQWEALAKSGARMEAWTGKEHTRLGLSCLPRDLPKVMAFVADVLRNPKVTKQALEHERKIVLDEIHRKRHRPEFLWTLVEEALYAPPYGMSILGSPDIVSGLNLKQMKQRALDACTPERTRLVIAGKVDSAAVRLIEEHFEDWYAAPLHHEYRPVEIVPRLIGVPSRSERVTLYLSFPGPALGDPDRPATEVFAALLGGGLRSRMFQRLREEHQLVYAAQGGSSHWRRSGYLFMAMDLARERVQEAFGRLTELMQELQTAPPSHDETDETRESFALRALQESEGPGLATKLAQHWLNDEVYFPTRAARMYRQVSAQDVQAAAGYLSTQQMAVVGIGMGEAELAELLEVVA